MEDDAMLSVQATKYTETHEEKVICIVYSGKERKLRNIVW